MEVKETNYVFKFCVEVASMAEELLSETRLKGDLGFIKGKGVWERKK